MKSQSVFLSVALGLLLSCHPRGNEQQFFLNTHRPLVMIKSGAECFQYWDLPNARFLWDTTFIQPPGLQLFKDTLENLLGRDTLKLTVQQLAFQEPSFKMGKTGNGDVLNAGLVHAKILGKIRPINFLEAQLLDYQISRYPLFGHPTEFHGFILYHDSLKLVRVYFCASDQPWPPKPKIILEEVSKDLKQGWKLISHLHNHYEPAAHHYLGILAPSMTDAQFYQFLSAEYGLEHALITNGFHTVDIQREEFPKLHQPATP
jgi:hypothetical protein